MNQDMNETMNEINQTDNMSAIGNKRQSLTEDIENLRKNIKAAQKEVNNSNLNTTLQASVSPEQANKNKRDLVFLERDLVDKQSEFEELDN
jgi:predicted GTPase